MKCLICNSSDNLKNISKYKLEIQSDEKYFKDCSIISCSKCDFGFVNPMPKSEILDFFYKNIYRSPNRPPFWYTKDISEIESETISDKNLNYLLYITSMVDFNKINSILDFGAGYGDIGYLLKKKFPHIELYSCEDDKYCEDILLKRNFKNFNRLSEINKKFDLVITLHSLEHLDNLEIFGNFYKILNEKGSIFFEVPNCTKDYFNGRIYDSPHLLFFTEKSFKKIAQIYNYKILNFSKSSYPFDLDHKYQKESQEIYNDLNQKKISARKIKKWIKKFIPQNIINFKKRFDKLKKINSYERIHDFTNNTGNNCYLRGVIKKNDY